MIAPGHFGLRTSADGDWRDWAHFFATTLVTAAATAVGTKLGEWAVETVRERVRVKEGKGDDGSA